MNAFFGEPWDAPACEGAPQVPTPVGEERSHCTVPVEDGDRGFMISHVGRDPDGNLAAFAMPWHRECLMRTTAGSRSTSTAGAAATAARPAPGSRPLRRCAPRRSKAGR